MRFAMLSRRKPATADHAILDLLRERWSARAFDDRDIEDAVLRRIFEAARWSPSSANEQPWRFVIARRKDEASFARLLGALTPRNQLWVRGAPLMGFSVARLISERTGQPNRWAWYDTGQSMAHLSIQATHEGLIVHQMAGYDAARAREAADIPDGFEPVSAFAIGYPGDPATLDETFQKLEASPRTRRPQADSLYEGRWGSPLRST